MALKRAGFLNYSEQVVARLLRAGVLGDCFGALGNSVLGKFTREEEPHSSLDLTGSDGGPLVVVSQAGGFGGDPLKQVIDE